MSELPYVGDEVAWSHWSARHGVRKFEGRITGFDPRRNTHVRVKTEKGNRYVRLTNLTKK